MSEFQYVGFRAADAPVSTKNLEYMRKQSTRAEITPWAFDNEYTFGDFHGDALGMLRRGYDVHLHYADFGIRKLLLRFPHGLPDAAAARPHLAEDGLQFLKDKEREGGILCIEPYLEPGDLDELWDLDEILDRVVRLRAEILDGDLRPLYLAHLAVSCDGDHDPEETKEAPVPTGLGKITDAQKALAEFYGLSDSLIAAAAQGGPSQAARADSRDQESQWLAGLSQATKDSWLAELMGEPESSVRRKLLAEFRKSRNVPAWPTVRRDRTIAELKALAEEIQQNATRKSAEADARKKAKRLVDMAADPTRTLRETERLVEQRGTDAYAQIASLLTELREALTGTAKSGLAEQQAQKLRKENPTLKMLISALRQAGFLPK
jgi:hypothetical protein